MKSAANRAGWAFLVSLFALAACTTTAVQDGAPTELALNAERVAELRGPDRKTFNEANNPVIDPGGRSTSGQKHQGRQKCEDRSVSADCAAHVPIGVRRVCRVGP